MKFNLINDKSCTYRFLLLSFSASGTNHGAIDNRIEQAMVSFE